MNTPPGLELEFIFNKLFFQYLFSISINCVIGHPLVMTIIIESICHYGVKTQDISLGRHHPTLKGILNSNTFYCGELSGDYAPFSQSFKGFFMGGWLLMKEIFENVFKFVSESCLCLEHQH